jgi:spermidine synthase
MADNNKNSNWVDEIMDDYMKISYKIKDTLFSKKSEYQQVDIVETEGYGRMLLNDGLVMISERDEFSYHDMISHVPMFIHPNPVKVLVIGGGDGGTVREVIRHPEVKTCYLVEIDSAVVDGCKEFIPQTSKALDDQRVTVKIEDGVKFVATTDEKFDVILIDSTDPIGPATPLFGEEFYTNVKKILNKDGIVVAQGESPFYEIETQKKMLGLMSKIFKHTHIYNYSNITYPGGMWSFWYGSDSLCPIKNFDPKRVEKSGLKFSYYNANLHTASFALPQFMTDELKEYLTKF